MKIAYVPYPDFTALDLVGPQKVARVGSSRCAPTAASR
jgi:hypothetical protein